MSQEQKRLLELTPKLTTKQQKEAEIAVNIVKQHQQLFNRLANA
jgi:hypothetical protein